MRVSILAFIIAWVALVSNAYLFYRMETRQLAVDELVKSEIESRIQSFEDKSKVHLNWRSL